MNHLRTYEFFLKSLLKKSEKQKTDLISADLCILNLDWFAKQNCLDSVILSKLSYV